MSKSSHKPKKLAAYLTPEYGCWENLRSRCGNPHCPQFEHYGALGVRCTFTSFAEFLAEVGQRPPGTSIDRRNPFGNYAAGNLEWSDRRTQTLNQRAARWNVPYLIIFLTLLQEGLTPEQAASLCKPIQRIEQLKRGQR